jgi:hypothetical protein
VQQELFTLPEHLRSPSVLIGGGTIGSVASLLAPTLYRENPDKNHKLWNIVSSERYILHMQVLLECCYIWVFVTDMAYSYEADFIQGLLKKNEKKLARSFHFTFRYIDDVLSLFRSDDFNFTKRNPWFSSFLVSSNPPSR